MTVAVLKELALEHPPDVPIRLGSPSRRVGFRSGPYSGDCVAAQTPHVGELLKYVPRNPTETVKRLPLVGIGLQPSLGIEEHRVALLY